MFPQAAATAGRFPAIAQSRDSAVSDRGYKSFIFDRAAVRTGVGVGNGLAAHRFIERNFYVVGRTRNVGWIRRSFAVDRAFVNDFAFGIDDEHVRSIARVIDAP